MICDSCNKQLRDGAKFCGQCGAKTKLSTSAPVAGTSEQKYELNTLSVNATGPDSDGDLSVEIKVSITNRSGSDWDQVNTRTQLISASGFIEETADTHDLSCEDGATEEFEVNFYGVKARPFMANPELTKTIINVVACSATSKKLTEIALPDTSFEVVKMQPCDISDAVKLLSGGIWRTDPDDDKDVRVEAKWLVKNLTDTHIPEVKFTAEVVGKSGAEIADAGAYEELRPGVSAVISGSTYAKEKKLKGATVQVGARVMSPSATGSSEHIGMEVSASEVADDDHHESDDEQDDNFASDFHSENDTSSARSGSVSFEWKMKNGEVNMDDVEDDEVSAALALALRLAKKEKFEDAVKALPSINFEYSFGNLDSDCSDYFGDPQDISFDLDLSDPKHSVSVGVSDGKLIISIAVVFEIPVQDGVVADELSEWLSENGGYAAGFAAGGWSYNGDEGGHMMVVDTKPDVHDPVDVDADKATLTGIFSLTNARQNADDFEKLMQDIGCDDSRIVGSYGKEDPYYVAGSNGGIAEAWEGCISINREEKSKKVLNAIIAFQHEPDIYSLWKYAILCHAASNEGLDPSPEMEAIISASPAVSWPSPWPILEEIGQSIDHCIESMERLNQYFETRQISEKQYCDGMGSLVLCYFSLTLIEEDDAIYNLGKLLRFVVHNEPLNGISFSSDLPYGEYMSDYRRYLEELSGKRVERPEGVDHEEDCYLDNVDWDEVAEELLTIS